jgi:SSS family solute:Na+ symporter
MIKDGIDANTPIYYSLDIGLISYTAVSLLSRQAALPVGSTRPL